MKLESVSSSVRRVYRLSLWVGLLATVSTGCGGGGGGGSSFAGTWTGSVSLVEPGCGLDNQDQPFISFSHLINQNADTVVLDNGAMTFTGAVTGAQSFSVSATRPSRIIPGDGGCTETITWRYENVKRDEAPFVVRSSEISCGDGTKCSFAFSGSGFRNGGGPITIDDSTGPDSQGSIAESDI